MLIYGIIVEQSSPGRSIQPSGLATCTMTVHMVSGGLCVSLITCVPIMEEWMDDISVLVSQLVLTLDEINGTPLSLETHVIVTLSPLSVSIDPLKVATPVKGRTNIPIA